jgi:gamma-glutamyltranspeptidase/glutathione hydrolase
LVIGDHLAAGGMRSEGPTPNVFPAPESLRPTVVGTRYVVSAGHHIAAEVAGLVLEQGGNAIDAGVAAGLASNVVLVDMCNLGGIVPVLLRPAGSGEVWSIAGVGTWGSDVTLDAFRQRYGATMPLGAGVAVVPAALDSWLTALARWGTWSFADSAAPAIELAESGFALDCRAAFALELFGGRWPTTRYVYWPKGRPPRQGDVLCQPALARLLRRLAHAEVGSTREARLESVREAFYEGDVAEQIVAFSRAAGGWLTLDDLAGFRSEVTPATAHRYGGWLVHTTGPWSQGPALLQALAILEGFDLGAVGHNSGEYLHLLIESIKLAFSDRERYYGDPRHVEVPLERLLSHEHAVELRRRIQTGVTLRNPSTVRQTQVPQHDTTSLCVVDAAGNVFSATPSDTLDGGPIVPELGIVVSPRGVQSRLEPNHASVLAPGKRPRVTPSPALALRDSDDADALVLAFGCPGGDVILQAMLQVFLNIVHFGMSPQQAVEAARVATFSFPSSFHPHTSFDGDVAVEARIPEEVRADLTARGHSVRTWPEWEFDAGAVSLALDITPPGAQDRVIAAGADPRRSTYAIGR